MMQCSCPSKKLRIPNAIRQWTGNGTVLYSDWVVIHRIMIQQTSISNEIVLEGGWGGPNMSPTLTCKVSRLFRKGWWRRCMSAIFIIGSYRSGILPALRRSGISVVVHLSCRSPRTFKYPITVPILKLLYSSTFTFKYGPYENLSGDLPHLSEQILLAAHPPRLQTYLSQFFPYCLTSLRSTTTSRSSC
jgi:hypothetical protein